MRKKKKKEERLEQEKKNQFIREQLRPQRKATLLLQLRKIAMLVVAACIFGVIAGGIILLMQSRFASQENNDEALYTEEPDETQESEETEEPDSTAAPSDDTGQQSTQSEELTLGQYNRISRELAAVGTQMASSLVAVKTKDSESWYEKDTEADSVFFGLVYQEFAKYYLIITTYDAVQDQSFVEVQMLDDTVVEGKILGSDEQTNLAVVRVDKSDLGDSLCEQITGAHFGSGIGLSAGTSVIAVGSPNGVYGSVVTGVITNEAVTVSITDGELQMYITNIAYSEAANGVVVDTSGRVVGMITSAYAKEIGTTGMAFVRISDLTSLLRLLRNGKTVPYLGIEGQTLTEEMAEAHHLEVGAYVTDVQTESPAYKAGMRVADVITAVDGEEISGMSDIYQNLMEHKVGDQMVYTVCRTSGDKKIMKEIQVKLK